MPKKNFPTVGDLQQYEYVKGVITDINNAADTCSAKVGEDLTDTLNIPIYYHCTPDAEEREDNGAIRGGAAGFAVGDEVIILKQRPGLDDKIFVIAHYDGIQRCGVCVKITLDGYVSDNNGNRSARLVQDIPDEETGENFTVIGTTSEDNPIDSLGVACIRFNKQVDTSKPLYLEIADETLFMLYTEDYGEDTPEFFITEDGQWYSAAYVYEYLDPDSPDWEWKVKRVSFKRYADHDDTTPVDLLQQEKTVFQNAAGMEVSGWETPFTDFREIHVVYDLACFHHCPSAGTYGANAERYYLRYVQGITPLPEAVTPGGCDGTDQYPVFCEVYSTGQVCCGGQCYDVPIQKVVSVTDLIPVGGWATWPQPFIGCDLHGNNLYYNDGTFGSKSQVMASEGWVIYGLDPGPGPCGYENGDPPQTPSSTSVGPFIVGEWYNFDDVQVKTVEPDLF